MLGPEGDGAMPLLFLDRTGIVTGIKSEIREYASEGISDAAAPDEGLEFVWGTGACDPGATITFERAQDETFRLVLDQQVGTVACLAVEEIRDLVIEVSEPVTPDSVHLAGDAEQTPGA